MTDTNFPLSADDDLPRTFRRARREHEAAQMAAAPGYETITPITSPSAPYPTQVGDEPAPAVVQAIEVPFVRLMLFFIKAVFAAIPALILLGGLIWLSGEILTNYFPELLKMKILIQFPN